VEAQSYVYTTKFMYTHVQKSSSGDTIILRGGTHSGGLVISKGLRIRGEQDAIVHSGVMPGIQSKNYGSCDARSQPSGVVVSILSKDHASDDAGLQPLDVLHSMPGENNGRYLEAGLQALAPGILCKDHRTEEADIDLQSSDILPGILGTNDGSYLGGDVRPSDLAPSISHNVYGYEEAGLPPSDVVASTQLKDKVKHKPRIQSDVFCCRAKGVVLENIRIEASCGVGSVYSADRVVYNADKEPVCADTRRYDMCSADTVVVYSADKEPAEGGTRRQYMDSADRGVYSADRGVYSADRGVYSADRGVYSAGGKPGEEYKEIYSMCSAGKVVYSADSEAIEGDKGRHHMYSADGRMYSASRGGCSADGELKEGGDKGSHNISAVHCVNIVKGTCELIGEFPRCVCVMCHLRNRIRQVLDCSRT
jgi:hypothetical protein